MRRAARSWRPAALAAILVAALLVAAPVSAATLTAAYTISLAGLAIGTAEVTSTFEGEHYRMDMQGRLTGLAGLFTSGMGGAVATGLITGQRPLPSSFSVTARSSSDERTLRLGLARGNVVAVDIAPPFEPKPDRVPVTEAHKRGVVDPASALLMPVFGRGEITDPSACNRTIPVFDGSTRFDVVLSYVRTSELALAGYRGPALVCNARYVPIAGHRPLRQATRFMMTNREMWVWLIPVEGTRILMPARISVKTMVGTSLVEAGRWSVERGRSAAQPELVVKTKAQPR